jgi:hypothetical protein
MEINEYKAVQCAPLSEKDEEIHTWKYNACEPRFWGSDRICQPKSNTKDIENVVLSHLKAYLKLQSLKL